MNISNLRESAKEECTNGGKKISEKPNLTTSISSWTKLKDPRIVRVSRAFGGKDRHSKVCTVRGLRDRRVRLSVPTAIQLYDLQDRLGLNQPSKVVDWLLNVAKNEIDELPPLQIPLGNFGDHQGFHESMINVVSDQSEKLVVGSNGLNWEDYWNNPNKSKEKDDAVFVHQSSNQSSSLPSMFNNGSFLKLDPSNLSLSQFGSYAPHQEDTIDHTFNVNMYPQPSHDHNSRDQFEIMCSSSSKSHDPLSSSLYTLNQGMIRPFHLSMNPKLFPDEPEIEHPSKGNQILL